MGKPDGRIYGNREKAVGTEEDVGGRDVMGIKDEA